MSENLQKLLKESLLNNSYDYDAMEHSIKRTWYNSYSYLYAEQKAAIEYEEFLYFSNEEAVKNLSKIGFMYLDSDLQVRFDLDYDMIHHIDREKYRVSNFYNTKISVEDLSLRNDIFYKIPIVIIDDRVIWNYKLNIYHDSISFQLPFLRNYIIKDERKENSELIYIEHKIQVLIVDNVFYKKVSMTKTELDYNTQIRHVRFPKSAIKAFVDADIVKSINEKWMKMWNVTSITNLTADQNSARLKEIQFKTSSLGIPSVDGIMFGSFHVPNAQGKKDFGSILVPIEEDPTDTDYYLGMLTDDLIELLDPYSGRIDLHLVFINHLYHKFSYDNSDKIIVTKEGPPLFFMQERNFVPYRSPVPIENFMVFKQGVNDKGYTLKSNREMLEMYYPNIYKIKDPDATFQDYYDIFYFYYKQNDRQYGNIFDFYFYFLQIKFQDEYILFDLNIERVLNDIYYNRIDLYKYYNDTQRDAFLRVFQKILDYKYYEHQYADIDFVHNYLPLPENIHKRGVEYKDERLKEWIRIEPWVLRDYVVEQKQGFGEVYHLWTNSIDLSKRLRTDTSQELDKEFAYFKFDEERYVFAMANKSTSPALLNCRIFVDGTMVNDVYQDRNLYMDYFYIPASMVTDDSYIEMEIFPSCEFTKDVTFTSLNDKKEITLLQENQDIFPTVADLYVKDKSSKKRFDKAFFKFTHIYKEGEFEFSSDDPKKPVKFTRLHTFTITPVSKEVLAIPFQLRISKRPFMVRFIINRNGYPYIAISDRNFYYHMDYIRIFRNGRLVPRSHYRLIYTFDIPRIMFFEWMDAGDNIYIDITPFRYTEIYYQAELQEGNPVIDLSGAINKPFDPRYYDIYMNGRKLSIQNIIVLAPQLITLVNLTSIYNLVIYEKDRDWEYFGLDYTENIYYFDLKGLYASGILFGDTEKQLLKELIDRLKDEHNNIRPNTNDEERQDWDCPDAQYPILHIFYFDELISKTFINPDVKQFRTEVMDDIYEDIRKNFKTYSKDYCVEDSQIERKQNYPEVLLLNPDRTVLTTDKDGDAKGMLVYSVGHLDEVEQVLFENQNINIPSKGNIDE